jgi:hypothetical protein
MIIFFLVLLAVSGLIDVCLGLWAILGWGSFASVFNLNLASGEDIRMMGFFLGLVLLFFAYVQVQALLWIRREKEVGYPIALAFAGFLVISSLLMSVFFRRMEFLAIDGIRGVLLGIFGTVAFRSPLTVKELRLPSRARRTERRHASTRGRRRGGRDASTRRPRRTDGRREVPAHASSRGSGSAGPRTRRSTSRRTTRRRAGTRTAEPDERAGPPTSEPERFRRGSRERYYDERRPSRRGREPARESAREPARESAREPAREPARESTRELAREPARESTREPTRESARESGAPPRRRRTPWAGPVVPPATESGAEEYREEYPEDRAPSRSVGEEAEGLEDRIVQEVGENPGPPKPFRQHGPRDVVSALDWLNKPKAADRGGQNDTQDNGSRHRRKPERSPGAIFRPKEKRVRRPLGGDTSSSGEKGESFRGDSSDNGEEE